jgi:t-SNARE complex subunit (syntaxin)
MQQIDFDVAVVEERDEAINDIAAAVMEVNETMRDLAQIVEDQGHDIEQIETNVTEAEASTAQGVEHLKGAEKLQKGYRKWIFVLIAIIVLAAGGITAYFVLSKTKPAGQ